MEGCRAKQSLCSWLYYSTSVWFRCELHEVSATNNIKFKVRFHMVSDWDSIRGTRRKNSISDTKERWPFSSEPHHHNDRHRSFASMNQPTTQEQETFTEKVKEHVGIIVIGYAAKIDWWYALSRCKVGSASNAVQSKEPIHFFSWCQHAYPQGNHRSRKLPTSYSAHKLGRSDLLSRWFKAHHSMLLVVFWWVIQFEVL